MTPPLDFNAATESLSGGTTVAGNGQPPSSQYCGDNLESSTAEQDGGSSEYAIMLRPGLVLVRTEQNRVWSANHVDTVLSERGRRYGEADPNGQVHGHFHLLTDDEEWCASDTIPWDPAGETLYLLELARQRAKREEWSAMYSDANPKWCSAGQKISQLWGDAKKLYSKGDGSIVTNTLLNSTVKNEVAALTREVAALLSDRSFGRRSFRDLLSGQSFLYTQTHKYTLRIFANELETARTRAEKARAEARRAKMKQAVLHPIGSLTAGMKALMGSSSASGPSKT